MSLVTITRIDAMERAYDVRFIAEQERKKAVKEERRGGLVCDHQTTLKQIFMLFKFVHQRPKHKIPLRVEQRDVKGCGVYPHHFIFFVPFGFLAPRLLV